MNAKNALLKKLKKCGQFVGNIAINVGISIVYKPAAGTKFKLEMLLNQHF
nr:MAG TPA: hypothetical protein [Caudoviricetes sp.]